MKLVSTGAGWLPVLLLAPTLALADSADSPKPTRSPLSAQPLVSPTGGSGAVHPAFDPMVVTGTRLPGDVHRAPMIIDVIERDDPALSTATRWEDVIAQQPGVHVAGSGRRNGQFLTMRGFDENGVQIRLDGVRQDIDTGHIGNVFLDPGLIQQVQIARGSLSSLYGGNAMGGVVSVTTVDAEDLLAPGEDSGARLSVSGATAAHELGSQVTLFGRQGSGTGARQGLVAIGYSDSGDIRRAGGQQAEEDADLTSLLAKGSWQFADHQELSASWQHYDEDSRQPSNPQVIDPDPSNPLIDREVTSDNAQLAHRWTPSETSFLETRLSLSRQDIDDESDRTLERYGIQSDGVHHLSHGWLDQTLAFGIEFERAEQDPSGGATGFPDADIDTSSVYLDDTLTVGRYLHDGGIGQFDLGLGLRYDSYDAEDNAGRDSDEDELSPKVRLSWRPTDAWVIYTGYAEAFRAPTLNELYANDRHFAGFCGGPFFCVPDNFWIPNPDLDPETSDTWETGFGWQQGDWSVRGSYFDIKADDFIDTSVDLFAGTTQAVNVSRAHLWGYDLRLGYQPSALPPLDTFVSVSRVSGKDRDSGEDLERQTPLEATLGADWHFSDADLTVGWRGRFARDFDDTGDGSRLPGYGLNDLQLAWQPSHAISTSLRLANVADQQWYRPDGSLGDGRSLLANISYQW
ncbi:TonB-dependent receptor domain-containing protein [Halomonas sp. DP8Y7-3]|uniref:TonB-dependent receptor domain-containing protein n=1 Tax=Halomonas sp. DP8Y7-3 TaxID=2859079 RepID=UPI0021BD00DF|nr:TonB-dependent receptor [Halomonas sp. DP8Y7-3]